MSSMFEVLASEDATEQERLAGTRAVIAAQSRAKESFGSFVGNAATLEERDSRISLISADLDGVLAEVAAEYGYDNVERLSKAATVALGGGHASDCSCGFCENKGSFGKDDDEKDELDSKDDDKMDGYAKEQDNQAKSFESSIKTACDCGECGPDGCDCDDCPKKKKSRNEQSAVQVRHTASALDWDSMEHTAEVETGDSYQSETLDLGSDTGKAGVQDTGSPKIDKSKVPAEGLKPIDVGSKRNELDHQDADDRADYTAADFDPENAVTDRIDPEKPLQPEHNVADNTKTWSGTEGLADPVTSSVAKWSVVTP